MDAIHKFLIKDTVEIRVETKQDANALHKEIEAFAHDNDYTLSSWTQTYKCRKLKGEIIKEYYFLCKYILIFNDIKEPENLLTNIEYNMKGKVYES